MTYSETLSADSYWMTDDDLQVPSQGGCALLPNDPTACGGGGGPGLTAAQSRLPANYQYDVTRLEYLQSLNGASKPVVVDVETGCPGFTGNGGAANCITPPAMQAAAMHALIAGARGIVWFQHNFAGPCGDDRSIIDGSNPATSMYSCQQTPGVTLHDMVVAVTTFDHEISSLDSVLLSPFADHYATVTSGVASVMSKYDGKNFYVFAGSGRIATPPPANQAVTFQLAGNVSGTITVLNEGRTLTVTNGAFTDTFKDANAYHVYKVN
jgi:hypothetical protein